MAIIELHLSSYKILVIGGGNVAYKKIKKLLKETTNITVLAPIINENIKLLPINLIEDYYNINVLNDYDIVYSATNDKILNHQIVKDANSLNKLTISIHKDQDVKISMLQSIDDEISVACSTHGKYPLLARALNNQVMDIYHNEYQTKMKELSVLREIIKKEITENKHDLLEKLLNAPTSFLQFILIARKRSSYVLLFHGNNNIKSYNDINKLIEKLGKHVYFACLSEAMSNNMFYLKELIEILNAFNIKPLYIPMLLQKGEYYHHIFKYIDSHDVLAIPFDNDLISDLYNQDNYDGILIHGCSNNELVERLNSISRIYTLKDRCEGLNLLVLLVLQGRHLQTLGYDRCLIDEPLVVKKLKEMIK